MINEIHLNVLYVFDPVLNSNRYIDPPGTIFTFINKDYNDQYRSKDGGGWKHDFILRNFREHETWLVQKILEKYGVEI